MLTLNGIEYAVGDRTLFSSVNLNINAHDRFGLVGANGTGKTTLLRIIAGDVFATAGSVQRAKDLSIGYLPQEEIVLRGNTLMQEVLKDYHGHLNRLSELEKKIAADPHSKDLIKEYEKAQDLFHKIGGYDCENNARKVAVGLGFVDTDFDRRVEEFSSGWQMRAVLARLLLDNPNLLLLDEPTNHLDIESIEWLENYLQNFSGAMIVVSHDRYFLDKVLRTEKGIRGILEIDFGGFRKYRTDYTGYLQESNVRKERLIKMAKEQERKIAEIKDFIARNKANKKKIGVVRSREKYLERLEIIKVEKERKKIRVNFPVAAIHSPQVVALKNASKSYGEKTVFINLNLVIENGNKIALIGKNGAGKSTLCRIIAGIENTTSGERNASEKLLIGAFSQEIMHGLDLAGTVMEEVLKDAPVEVHQSIRSYLGSFLFSGDDVFKKTGILSGGEKTRLVILKTMLKPSNLLILDEPTYHLDKDSVEAIKQAISQYRGTIIFVTHDRDLIASFANRILELKNGVLRDYPGDYDYYLWKRAGKRAQAEIPAQGRKERRTKETPVLQLKRLIFEKEARRNKLRDIFSRPGMTSSPRKAKKLFEEYQRLADEIEALEKELAHLGAE